MPATVAIDELRANAESAVVQTISVEDVKQNCRGRPPHMAQNQSLPILISELLRRADAAQPIRVRDTSGLPRELSHLAPESAIQYIRQPAVASLMNPAASVDLASLFNKGGALRRVPGAADAGSTVRLATGLALLSRVALAGAGVIQWEAADKAIPVPGGAGRDGVAFMRRPNALRVVKPAAFSVLDQSINDDAEVADQPQPVLVAPFDFPKNCKTLAAAFTVKRSERRDTDPGILADEIATAVALGLANEADRLLLAAINATTPAAFTLSKLAAAGMQLDDLQAITSGSAAAVGADGVLRAAGVSAQLTGQAAGTLVGDFTRSALVIGERFDMHARKLGRSGDLEITVLVDVLPVVADAGAFWTVAA